MVVTSSTLQVGKNGSFLCACACFVIYFQVENINSLGRYKHSHQLFCPLHTKNLVQPTHLLQTWDLFVYSAQNMVGVSITLWLSMTVPFPSFQVGENFHVILIYSVVLVGRGGTLG